MPAKKKVLIIGLGRFGSAIADDLWSAGIDTVVLDSDPDAAERVRDRCSAAFVGDATDPDVLAGIGVKDLDVAVVSFGRYFEAAVLSVCSLAELGAPEVVARAETLRQRSILLAVGADRVIQVEHEMGTRVAKELRAPVTQELLDFAEHHRVLPWEACGALVGQRLGQTNLRNNYGILVLGYRRRDEQVAEGQKPRLHIPSPNYEIQQGDTLLIVGDEDEVMRFVDDMNA